MLKRTFCAAMFIAAIFFSAPVWCGAAEGSSSNNSEHKGLKQMRAKVKKGLTHAELTRYIGEPDYCIGEYLECRYASAQNCITNGRHGVRTLVIWFSINRVISSDILCVAE